MVVEAEYLPAFTAQAEAKPRLGLEVASNGRVIEAIIALRYPEWIGAAADLNECREMLTILGVHTVVPTSGPHK